MGAVINGLWEQVELPFLDVFKNITIGIEINGTEAEELTRSSLGVSSKLFFFSMILANAFSYSPKLAVLHCFH